MSYRLLSKRKSNNIKQGWHDYFLKGRVADGGGMRNALPQFNYFHFHAAFGNNYANYGTGMLTINLL